jgi:hypothetical protein
MRVHKLFLFCISFVAGLCIYLVIGAVVILPLAQVMGIADINIFESCGKQVGGGAYFIHAYVAAQREIDRVQRELKQALADKRGPNRIAELKQRQLGHENWQNMMFEQYKATLVAAGNFTQVTCERDLSNLKAVEFKGFFHLTEYADRFMELLALYRETGRVNRDGLAKDIARMRSQGA